MKVDIHKRSYSGQAQFLGANKVLKKNLYKASNSKQYIL